MAKRRDLIGMRFTHLLVLSFAYTNSIHRACWLCQCDCGNTKIYSTDALIQGHAKSCGCMPHKTILDLTGNTYGELLVLKFDHLFHQSFWLCRCKCGKEIVVRGSDLTTGHTKSCGCTFISTMKEITWVVDSITGCWNCNSHSYVGNGYPVAYRDGLFEPISRHHYRKYKGEIPLGMLIRHTCDNIKCINPSHLLVGTTQDNVNDKVERNRQPKGEDIPASKLLNAQVVDIFINNELTRKQLATKYDVTVSNVKLIKQGKSWKHITQRLDDRTDIQTDIISGWSSDEDILAQGFVRD